MLLEIAGLSKSTYSYHMQPERYRQATERAARETALETAVTAVFASAYQRYGYRRIHQDLKDAGVTASARRVRLAMRRIGLVCQVRRKRRRTMQQGGWGKRVPNRLRRQWRTTTPNQKWVTDITQFLIRDQCIYLSPIMDLYDRQIIAYTIAPSPTFAFTNEALRMAVATLQPGEHVLVHSDQGFHYQHPSWQQILSAAGATQSMSRKGNPYDNAVIESFFSHLKEELVNHRTFDTVETFVQELHSYIAWYNTKRISMKLNGMCPVHYRTYRLATEEAAMQNQLNPSKI